MNEPPPAPGRVAAPFARFAVLPTVWSNSLAAAWLAHAEPGTSWGDLLSAPDWPRTVLVVAGASVAYAGTARARPPGDTTPTPDRRLSLALLLAGGLVMALAGRTPATLALVLVAALGGELSSPRTAPLGPVFQGLARLALFLAVAATLPGGINGWVIWGGVVLAAFVAGSGYIVRQQELGQPAQFPPWLLLAAPLVLAWVMNNGPYRQPALLLGAVLVLWLARGAYRLFRPAGRTPGAAGILLPAIVLVDWLAIADAPRTSGLILLPLFALALVLAGGLKREA
jgi:hypothetical protein